MFLIGLIFFRTANCFHDFTVDPVVKYACLELLYNECITHLLTFTKYVPKVSSITYITFL